MTVLEEFAALVTAMDAAAIPAAARETLALHIADTVGAAIGGAATADGRAATGLIGEPVGGAGVAALADAPLDRMAVACAVTRLSEVDDIHLPSGTTPSAIVVPAAISLSADLGVRDAGRFADAVVAGLEVMTRLGTAIGGHSTGYRGLWATYFTAPVAVAAVTARLLELDVARTAHALAIAFTLISGRVGRPGADRTARWLAIGQAARAGGFAALTASRNFIGDLALLDGDWLHRAHDVDADSGVLTAPADDAGVIPQISLKPYCAAKQMVAAICGFEEILRCGIAPGDIEDVTIHVPQNYAAMIDHGVVAGVRLSSLTSAPYQLAMAAYHRDCLFDVARSEFVLDERVTVFMDKVRVAADSALGEHFPANWPARVAVRTATGSEEITVVHAPGDPGNPLGRAEIERKFHRLADGVLGDQTAAWFERAVMAPQNDTALAGLQSDIRSLTSPGISS